MTKVTFSKFGNVESFSVDFDKVTRPSLTFDEIFVPVDTNPRGYIITPGLHHWDPMYLSVDLSDKTKKYEENVQKQIELQYRLSAIVSDPKQYEFDLTVYIDENESWTIEGAAIVSADWNELDALSDVCGLTLKISFKHAMQHLLELNGAE